MKTLSEITVIIRTHYFTTVSSLKEGNIVVGLIGYDVISGQISELPGNYVMPSNNAMIVLTYIERWIRKTITETAMIKSKTTHEVHLPLPDFINIIREWNKRVESDPDEMFHGFIGTDRKGTVLSNILAWN